MESSSGTKRKPEGNGEQEVDQEGNPSSHDENVSNTNQALVVKKQKTGDIVVSDSQINNKQLMGVTRTSGLYAPIMLLTGHKAEVYSVKFSPSGNHVVSGGFDKLIFLWDTYGECQNYGLMRGHTNAVLDVAWSADEERILSASADKTVAVWDSQYTNRIRKLAEHRSVVNCVSPPRRGELLVSGSDDATTKIWDWRSKASVVTYDCKFPVMSACFSLSGDQVFTAGLDNDIKVWDVRKAAVIWSLEGHMDTVSGIKLSNDGSYLLSNSMDNSLRIWDVRPFAIGNRCIKVIGGIQHNYEKVLLRCSWSPDGSRVSGGSSDRFVYVWDTASAHILYKLPGHRGSVNEVDFHPKEPIIASASSDQTIYLGEIKPY